MIGTTVFNYAAPRSTDPFNIAARQAMNELGRRERIRAMYGPWNGRHCCFIYTSQTLLDWPGVPTFKGDKWVS